MVLYRAFLADPPWPWAARSKKGTARGAVSHYDIMSMEEIMALGPQIRAMADDDCVLFLWSINSMLEPDLQVINAWGFVYKTKAWTWVKKTKTGEKWHYGLGFWTRQNTESCLLATRGNPKRLDRISEDATI